MRNYDNKLLTRFPVFNGYAPATEHGPLAVPLTLDFTTDGDIYVDLTKMQTEGLIGGIQSVYVDNSQNAAALTVTVKQTGQRIVFPAGIDATQPIFAPLGTQIVFSTTQAALSINAQLLNVPLAPSGLGPITVNTTITLTGSYTAAADSTLDAGGVSQQLFAANAVRKGLLIQNPSSEIESLWLNFGAAATMGAGSFELVPGDSFQTQLQITTQAVNWIAATIGHTITGKELA